MAQECHLLLLPDLVLYHICAFITCPFDLLHFGSTCIRLRGITLSQSLWWSSAFYWFRGLFIHVQKSSHNPKPREWMLDMMKHFSTHSSITNQECIFTNGEKWERVDSNKLRFLFGLLRIAYLRAKNDHPAILFEEWLYDIGLYKRIKPCLDYGSTNLEFSENTVLQLCSLGQASERDLRRRKQPNKNPKYYIKHVSSSEDLWMSDLFPSSINGSICPLLICPFQDAATREVSGLEGLSVCISIVLEDCIKIHHNASNLSLADLNIAFQLFRSLFVSQLMKALPSMEERFGKLSIRAAVLTAVENNMVECSELQDMLNKYNLNLKVETILQNLTIFLKKSESIDHIVDEIRLQIRKAVILESVKVLCPDEEEKTMVTRINLTDSDLIGGDNSYQEMSAAAFISKSGVLVTWHLTGRIRI